MTLPATRQLGIAVLLLSFLPSSAWAKAGETEWILGAGFERAPATIDAWWPGLSAGVLYDFDDRGAVGFSARTSRDFADLKSHISQATVDLRFMSGAQTWIPGFTTSMGLAWRRWHCATLELVPPDFPSCGELGANTDLQFLARLEASLAYRPRSEWSLAGYVGVESFHESFDFSTTTGLRFTWYSVDPP